ncbi:MAG: alpha/beta hydrolase [Gammaproteobacteria bacterium]
MTGKIVVRIGLVIVALYLAACSAMYFAQRSILFPADTHDVALDVNRLPNASVVELHTVDTETLKAWWVPPANDSAPVYLYFHGNAETLASRDGRFALLTQDGAGLLGVSWRGYGGSTGSPSEQGFRHDGIAAYEWLMEQGIDPQRLIVFGESIGTNIALWLSARQPTGGLVLDSPYTAVYELAQLRYPWLPVELLSRDPMNSMLWVGQIDVPTYVFHCTGDRVVPYEMGEEVFAALATNDKEFERIERQCHVPSVEPLMSQLRELEGKVSAIN